MDLSKLTPFHVIRYSISTEADDDNQTPIVEFESEVVATTVEELANKLAELVRETVASWADVDTNHLDYEMDYGKMYLARPLVDRVNDNFATRVSKRPASSYRVVDILGYTIEMRHPDGKPIRAPYDDEESEWALFDRVIAARDEAHEQARARHADEVDRAIAERAKKSRDAKLAEIARLQAELDAE